MSEGIVDVTITDLETLNEHGDCIIEPIHALAEKYAVLLDLTLIHFQQSKPVVRIMNPFPQPATLWKNTIIGLAELMDEDVLNDDEVVKMISNIHVRDSDSGGNIFMT